MKTNPCRLNRQTWGTTLVNMLETKLTSSNYFTRRINSTKCWQTVSINFLTWNTLKPGTKVKCKYNRTEKAKITTAIKAVDNTSSFPTRNPNNEWGTVNSLKTYWTHETEFLSTILTLQWKLANKVSNLKASYKVKSIKGLLKKLASFW